MPTAKRNNRAASSQAKTERSPKPPSKSRRKSTTPKPVKSSNKAIVKGPPRLVTSPLVEARNSKIHGRGVYAVKPIAKGTRIFEYLGERVSHYEADSRYELKPDDDGHTFLFVVDARTVIDAAVNGNDARFINHSCDPNCETIIENRRVFIEAIRAIKPGEELGYDYQLTWESTDEPQELALYDCRCGAKNCRGSMLDPVPLDKKKKKQARKSVE